MNLTGLLFSIVMLVTLFAAWRVVVSAKIMHSALWLGLSFFGTAAVFLFLGSDFLAAAQVLVYVGAVTTVLIFGIMLSDVKELRGEQPGGFWRRLAALWANPRRGFFPVVAALGFAFVMLAVYRQAGWAEGAPPLLLEDTPVAIGRDLFTVYVVPFELASAVLLVALIGAIALAMREEGK